MTAKHVPAMLACWLVMLLPGPALFALDTGEIIERQLTASFINGTNRVLDLDTGRVLSVPADRVALNNPRPFFNWLVKVGGDLTVDIGPEGRIHFRVDDGRIVQLTNALGSVSAAGLEQRLEKEGHFQDFQLTLAEAQTSGVLAFKTREGSLGVMELAAFTRKPAGATIRYKLLKAANLEPPNTASVFNVLHYGAAGDGNVVDTEAIQKAVDACSRAGGGQVLLPGGNSFLSGAIHLKSGMDFHVARGATLIAHPDWRSYGRAGALLFAKDAQGISISGDGTIRGNDRAVWQKLADEEAGGNVNDTNWWPQAFCGDYWPFGRKPGETRDVAGRPRMVLLINCSNLRIRGVSFRNAPSWTIHPVGCDDLLIESISIRNDWNVANNDGIDPDHCRNVRIANCHIDTADDGIVIKNTPNFAEYGGSENITVTGCTIASRSCALKLDEAYAPPGIRNVVFTGCTIFRSNRGLCIQSRDAGDIENVIFSNMVIETSLSPHKWWGAAEPIHISHYPRTADTKLGHVRHIRFSNLLCKSENGVYLRGWEARPIEDVVFENVRIEVAKTSHEKGGFYDGRPDGLFRGIYTNTIAGVHAAFVDGLSLRNTQVRWGHYLEHYYGPALEAHHVQALDIATFSGSSAAPGKFPDRIIKP